jgi:hypothetical protein
MLDKVKLLNGTEVPWEEFSKWSYVKQRANLVRPNLPPPEVMSDLIKAGRRRAGLYENPAPQNTKGKLSQGGFVCPYGQFTSRAIAVEAAKKLGLKNAQRKISALCKTDPQNYYFINGVRKLSSVNIGQAIQTPYGRFSSVRACAEALGVTTDRVYKRVKAYPNKYFYI